MHISRWINRCTLPITQMLDLFTVVPDEPELPVVEITVQEPAIVEALPVTQCMYVPKTYMKSSEALPIYNAVVDHLAATNVPPYSTFRLKGVTPNLLKWCIDSEKDKADELVLYMMVERQGQNPDDINAVYHEWERIYSRSVNSSHPPLGISSKPRKQRKARGSRHSNREMLVD